MSSSKRMYFILIGAICLLGICLLAGAYGTNQLLSARAQKLTGLKAKGQALTQEQESLASAKKDVQKYGSLEQIAKVVVPQDKDQAEAVREIVNLSGKNGVNLASITFPNSTLGTSVVSSTGVSSRTTAPATTLNTNSPLNALSQLQAVKNIPGVYLLQITIANDTKHAVAYTPFISFLSDMEHNRRTAQVSSINLQPLPTNLNLFTFSLTLNEYIKP